MAFPASPTVGQIHTALNGVQYIYTALGTWKVVGAADLIASQAEVDAGLVANKFVSPATLEGRDIPPSLVSDSPTALLNDIYTIIAIGAPALNTLQDSVIGANNITVGAQYAGLFHLNLSQLGNGTPAGASAVSCGIDVNGVSVTVQQSNTGLAFSPRASCGTIRRLNAGDVVRFFVIITGYTVGPFFGLGMTKIR